jgi:deoxyribonuclease IV
MLIGAHESIAGGVSRAFARGLAHGAQSIQVFTRTARSWSAPPLAEAERKAFRAEARRSGLPAIAHASYLCNLASEDSRVRARSLECLTEELTRCQRLGIPWLVLHPGAHPNARRGLRQIVAAIDEVHVQTPRFRSRICLEHTAGQGHCLGWRFEHLAEILQRARHPDRLGVCLDTCHLHAAGYDMTTEASYEKVLAQFDRMVGLRQVRCFHLNDSKKPLGSRVDRHEEIGRGTVGVSVFKRLVNDPRFTQTVGVLETPVQERFGEALRLLHSLVRG